MQNQDFTALIARLRRQGSDDASVEAKAAQDGLPKSIWETVSAFANTSGGTIILGLDESAGFAPVEGFDLDRVRDQFVSGVGDEGADNALIAKPPQYELSRQSLDGSQVLVVEVSEADPRTKPCYITRRGIRNGSYKRIDDKDVKLSPTEVDALQSLFVPSPADRTTVENATEADLDQAVVDAILSAESLKRAHSMTGAATREEKMQRLNIVDGNGGVRLAGLLAAGTYPQQFFPRFVVDVVAYPGVEKGIGGAVRYLDRVICEGPLHEQIDSATAAVMKNLRTAGIVEGVGRIDVPEIPASVVREAVANAVVHRDYGEALSGMAVTVDVFDDRVVVTNPGGLWGGKTLENIADGVSRCRNGALMRLAQAIPSAAGSPAEGAGTGVPLMTSEMRAAGLADPVFKADIGTFRVTLYRPGFPNEGAQARHTVAAKKAPAEKSALRGAQVEYAVMQLLEEESAPLGIQEIADRIGVAIWTARRSVRSLVNKGVVTPTASATSRNRRYQLVG